MIIPTIRTLLLSSPSAFSPGDLAPLMWISGDDSGATIDATPDPDVYITIPNAGSWGGSLTQGGASRRPEVTELDAGLIAPAFPAGSDNGLAIDGAGITKAKLAILHDSTSDCTMWQRCRVDVVTSGARIWDSVAGAGPGMSVRYNGSSIGLLYTNGTNQFLTDPSPLATGWHDIIAIKSGATVSLYLDGSLVAGPTAITNPTSADVAAGIWGNYAGYNIASGTICAEMAIFGSALDSDQRAALRSYGSRWGG
jgi:hypothetical protein